MLRLLYIFLGINTLTSCYVQKSQLPKTMPSEIKIQYDESGGISSYFTETTFIKDSLFVKEYLHYPEDYSTPKNYAIKIEPTEVIALYKIIVDNKFDLIKNKNNKPNYIAYDDIPESIRIILPNNISYNRFLGIGYAMDKKNLKRYSAVKNAIFDLCKKYKTKNN